MEAMAAGRPVIATRTSGIPDLIRDGENGCLVEPGSVASFASALEQMLNRADLEALGAAGREKMKSEFYCPEKSAKFVNICRELLGRQR
jgi:glycosyltransferase involved in cell wall biosynthesis